MKNLLRAGAAILVLAAMTAALVFVFATMGRSPGQLAAQGPTPVPTPTKPTPAVLLSSPPITPSLAITVPSKAKALPPDGIDLTLPPRTTPWTPPTPGPTWTPVPATGGPYISEARAIEIALNSARAADEFNAAIPPKAIFARGKDVPAFIGKPNSVSASEREVWLVVLEGRFTPPRSLIDPASPGYRKPIYGVCKVVMDATTGVIDIWGLQNELP